MLNGHKDIVSFLLKEYHSINVCNEKQLTPLFIAVDKCYTKIVEALLKRNANVNINKKKDGTRQSSPLLQATLVGHFDI